jgi:hexosaminidase
LRSESAVPPEVAAYQAAVTATPGLISYYKFDGSTVKDDFGCNNLNPSWSGWGVATYASGIGGGSDKALTFDDSGNGVPFVGNPGDSPFNFTNGQGTVEMWLKAGWRTYTGPIARGPSIFSDGWNDKIYFASMTPDKTKIVLWNDGIATPRYFNLPTAAGTNWHHLGVLFHSGNATVVWDGQSLGTQAYPLGKSTGAATFTLGSYSFHQPASLNLWIGELDEVAVYSNALPVSSLAAHYAVAGVANARPVTRTIGATARVHPPAIIPQPAELKIKPGSYELTERTGIRYAGESAGEAQKLAASLNAATGFKLSALPASAPATTGGIFLSMDGSLVGKLGAEGYELSVSPSNVTLRAATAAGLFYGGVTLRQLLPAEIFSSQVMTGISWRVPCVEIVDKPRFPWRGFMLDVSRHFFNKAEIKKTLVFMSLHKLNTLHLHLTDDEGWRVEIKKYPLLTKEGAWRKGPLYSVDPKSITAYGPDGRYGGFYTQADIREMVAYARKLHITIVPEIEVPGHCAAATRVFPYLKCVSATNNSPGSAAWVAKGAVSEGVYCAGNDATFEFLTNVLTEVVSLFPSQYIHVGGDEVNKGAWHQCVKCQARMKAEGLKDVNELQGYFMRRVEKFIAGQGRRLLSWGETSGGGLSPSATFMDWIGGGIEAAKAGHDVVMTPTLHCYFDYYQSLDQGNEPHAFGGNLPLDRAYAFEPIPEGLAPDNQAHILGGQGLVWTECISTMTLVEYMAFPRLSALAEAVWSPRAARNFDDFKQRLPINNWRLEQMGVNYRPERSEKWAEVKIGQWNPALIATNRAELEWDVTTNITASGKYRVNFIYTQGADALTVNWVALLEDGREVYRDRHYGAACQVPVGSVYTVLASPRKVGARYTIRAEVAGTPGKDSFGNLFIESKEVGKKP